MSKKYGPSLRDQVAAATTARELQRLLVYARSLPGMSAGTLRKIARTADVRAREIIREDLTARP